MFPLGSGYLYVVVGLYTSQSLIFWVSRLLVHRRVQRWIELRPKMNAISRAIEHDGIKLLLLLRLAPIPASPISYLMGASRMKFWRFCVANLGLLPVAFVSQYVGYAAIHATRATAPKHSTLTIQDLSLYGGLAVAIIIVGFIGHIAHKALKEIEANA
ncbi:MAG: TVP38/TMEM64 family protein, partial [Puniceicoccales bacterium]